jgi:competence ComEA-like helix-hairpin-helix protein
MPIGRSFPRAVWLLAVASALLGASVAMTAPVGQNGVKPAPDVAIESDEELATIGEMVVADTCTSQCHGMESLVVRRTVVDWNDVVAQMVDRGLAASEQDLSIARQYLKRFYGLVAVNSASADELAAVLGLTPRDARAVVEYRSTHGAFTDTDALKRVPGIDLKKIDAQPDALRFK